MDLICAYFGPISIFCSAVEEQKMCEKKKSHWFMEMYSVLPHWAHRSTAFGPPFFSNLLQVFPVYVHRLVMFLICQLLLGVP